MRRVIFLWFPRFATDRISRGQPNWRSEPLVIVRSGDVVKKRKLDHANMALGMNSVRTGFSVRVAEANKVANKIVAVKNTFFIFSILLVNTGCKIEMFTLYS